MTGKKNLGVLSGPLLIFGGPYSNLQATQALFAEAETRKIPPENMICTGDITAYCGNPQETAHLIWSRNIPVIQGNCEESLAADRDDCQCGYVKDSACASLAEGWYQLSKIEVSTELKQWMGTLPTRLEFNYAGRRVHVLHGSNETMNEFVFPSSSMAKKRINLTDLQADIILAGHSGIPFTQKIGDHIWHNAGVIGLPANDGTARTWYSIIDCRNEEIIFSHHALSYDVEGASQQMRKYGLNEYADTLHTGILPSLESLAATERHFTGMMLAPGETVLD